MSLLPAREDLPVYFMWTTMNPQREGIMDRRFLEDSGAIEPDPSVPLEESAALVASHGLTGAYARHVRATGAIYVCPSWCVSDDHARVGIMDQEHGELPIHEASAWSWGGPPAGVSGSVVQEAYVTVSGMEGEAPRIEVFGTVASLSPEDARAMAGALIAAADTFESITSSG